MMNDVVECQDTDRKPRTVAGMREVSTGVYIALHSNSIFSVTSGNDAAAEAEERFRRAIQFLRAHGGRVARAR